MDHLVVSAAALIIGNEILSGRTEDRNIQFIAEHLIDNGVTLTEARVIPDVRDVIVEAVNHTRERFDYVFTTGGIGPTHDDITAECVAAAFGVPLVINEEIAQRIRQRPASEQVMKSRLLMARVPSGATLIENSTGGPQGFCIDNVYVMAGIPSVLRAMLPNVELHGGAYIHSESVRVYVGESQIADDLTAIQEAEPGVEIGSYPFSRRHRYGTTLVVRSADTDKLDATIEKIKHMIIDLGEDPH